MPALPLLRTLVAIPSGSSRRRRHEPYLCPRAPERPRPAGRPAPRTDVVTGFFISLSLATAVTEAAGVRRERAPWRASAACRQADTELFFPIGSSGQAATETHQAKAL